MIDTATVKRSRGQASRQDEVENWLLNLLSGGSRQANEIFQAASLRGQGYSEKSLRNVKRTLEPRLRAFQKNRVWFWRDTTVPEIGTEPENFQEKLMHKLDEVARLTQVPRAVTDEGIAPEIREQTDGLGYSLEKPQMAVRAMSITDVIHRVRQLLAAGTDHDEIVRQIFGWAYPGAGFAESVLATLLKSNGVTVKSKSILFPAAHTASEF